jgi:cytochrome aa3 quinol oxidase subunit IV
MHQHHGAGKHITGLILSIVLTVIALWLVLSNALSKGATLAMIVLLAVVQALVQLFLFMHVTEKDETNGTMYHKWMLWVGFAMVVVIIGGSIWIMSFGGQAVA